MTARIVLIAPETFKICLFLHIKMSDLLDTLKKEIPSETKLLKVERNLEDYSESYKNVVFEEHALRQNQNSDKCTFSFQDSLDSLIKRGYSRHPRPNEAFSLLCAYLEGDLSIKNIAEDMLNSHGEWFSLAMKYQNNIFHCYIDPIFEIVDNGYNLKNCSIEKVFALSSLDGYHLSIEEVNALNPLLVEFLWSRSFDKLPLGICNNAYLYLSNDEQIWPAGPGGYDIRYFVDGYYDRASRGVR